MLRQGVQAPKTTKFVNKQSERLLTNITAPNCLVHLFDSTCRSKTYSCLIYLKQRLVTAHPTAHLLTRFPEIIFSVAVDLKSVFSA